MSTQKSIEALQKYMSEQLYEKPADVIADIMHYCDKNNIDFDDEVNTANKYYNDDLEMQEFEEDYFKFNG